MKDWLRAGVVRGDAMNAAREGRGREGFCSQKSAQASIGKQWERRVYACVACENENRPASKREGFAYEELSRADESSEEGKILGTGGRGEEMEGINTIRVEFDRWNFHSRGNVFLWLVSWRRILRSFDRDILLSCFDFYIRRFEFVSNGSFEELREDQNGISFYKKVETSVKQREFLNTH